MDSYCSGVVNFKQGDRINGLKKMRDKAFLVKEIDLIGVKKMRDNFILPKYAYVAHT